MAPLVRRSWSPRGQTPIVHQRTRSHRKVSVIAALCVSPERDQVRLCFRLHPDANIATPQVIDFLRILERLLHAPIMLVWDRLQAHRAKRTRKYLDESLWFHSHFLPPYAPELNPVENVWSYLKMNPLANFAPVEVDALAVATRRHGRAIQHQQHLLRAFIQHTPLPLRLR